MKKSVRVESNDPDSPVSILHVEGSVEIDAGDEEFSLDMGNVLKHGYTTRLAHIDIGKKKWIKVTDIVSSSALITAKEVVQVDSTAKRDSLHFEITVAPGMETGLLSEKVTISFKDDARPRANFYLYGIVVEDIEVTPLMLSYVVSGDAIDAANMTRKLSVINYIEDHPLKIIGVTTPGNELDLTVKTIEEGKRFEITAVANKNMLSVKSTLESIIHIATDNPECPSVEIPFRVARM